MSTPSLPQRVGWWAHTLMSLAQRGLHFSRDPHDRANFDRVLKIAAEMRAALDDVPAPDIERRWREEPSLNGPLPAVDAAIFDAQGRILLIQRADDGLWAMPGGMVDAGETAAEAACRETWEETGLTVRPTALMGVWDSRFCGTATTWQLYQAVFQCEPVAGEPGPSDETLDACWFDPDALPPLSPGHANRIAYAITFYRSPEPTAYFDRPAL